jgi:hypothetical protein
MVAGPRFDSRALERLDLLPTRMFALRSSSVGLSFPGGRGCTVALLFSGIGMESESGLRSTFARRWTPGGRQAVACGSVVPGYPLGIVATQTKFTVLRCGALLAVNLLFLMVWGFTGIGKLMSGVPPWFGDKFGKTILASFPGLRASFWLLALAEVLAFALAAAALARGEFLARKPPVTLAAMLVWSLFVFGQLGLGQWLTAEYNGTYQLFMYFCGTLLALQFVLPGAGSDAAARNPAE